MPEKSTPIKSILEMPAEKPIKGQVLDPFQKRALEKIRSFRQRGIQISTNEAGILCSLEDIVASFQRFIDEDLGCAKDNKSMDYKSSLSLSEFYGRRAKITESIIDVSMLLKVTHPHLRYLHSDVPKMFKEMLYTVELEGKKPAAYQLLHRVIEYQYELVSAITSGRSTTILETMDIEFMDTLKVYREALKSLKPKEDWLCFVLIQQLVKLSGGELMSVRDLSNKTGFSFYLVDKAVDTLFEKCKEILNFDARGQDHYISLPPIYAKYELIKF